VDDPHFTTPSPDASQPVPPPRPSRKGFAVPIWQAQAVRPIGLPDGTGPKPPQVSTARPAETKIEKRIRKTNEELAARYDALSLAYQEIEKQLRELKPVHGEWIEFNRQLHPNVGEHWELVGFTKYNDTWRLCYGVDDMLNEEKGTGFDIKVLSECPVDVRVRVAPHIQTLFLAIVKAKQDYIPKVDEAIQHLKGVGPKTDVPV
jgi:hypothetical protein